MLKNVLTEFSLFSLAVPRLRGFSTSSALKKSIEKVAVIGGGIMGTGVALVTAQNGFKVSLMDSDQTALDKSKAGMRKTLTAMGRKFNKDKPKEVENFVESALGNVEFHDVVPRAVEGADLVVECISENTEAKKEIFRIVDEIVPKETILVTNTSSLSVTKISEAVKERNRFAGLHFFNPVPIMKLVEVVRTSYTSEETISSLLGWVEGIKKVPIPCKDTPGFIVNRLLFPLVTEAIRMYERGDADAKSIDAAMKLGANHPIGPIELADNIGHDTIVSIIQAFKESDPTNPLFQPLKSQLELVKQGKLGVKTGEGYLKYK